MSELGFTCVLCGKRITENETIYFENSEVHICLECLLTKTIVKEIADKKKLKAWLKKYHKDKEKQIYERVFGKGRC